MSPNLDARTAAEPIGVGAIVRLHDALPAPAQLIGERLDLMAADGTPLSGVVAGALPDYIVVRLPEVLIYLVPASTQGAPLRDDRTFNEWVIKKIEHNLEQNAAASPGEFEEIDTETPDGEQVEQAFVEGQLPGMPVSKDVMREPGPTPAQIRRPVQD